ncbi:hypothetical protein HDV01_002931 [Terramyces sp. JEL0728]|nr:hypothetical protein HDV01_002931 [Terramyces sp. JEL0728]
MQIPFKRVCLWIALATLIAIGAIAGFALLTHHPPRQTTNYTISKSWDANAILNGQDWIFEPKYFDSDKGYVNYVAKQEAVNLGIYKIVDNQLYIGAKQVENGPPKSVKIKTAAPYNGGLWIFDSTRMPTGPGTWPSFWSVGPKWPNNGEIDILEGVNGFGNDTISIHSSSSCLLPISGKLTDCSAPGSGCADRTNANLTFGDSFNKNQGGIYAMEWVAEPNGWIKVWFFPRGSLPSDFGADTVVPSNWPIPDAYAEFNFGSNCDSSNFNDHIIIVNLAFCGKWSEDYFQKHAPYLSTDCRTYLGTNSSAFNDIFFHLSSIRYYVLS